MNDGAMALIGWGAFVAFGAGALAVGLKVLLEPMKAFAAAQGQPDRSMQFFLLLGFIAIVGIIMILVGAVVAFLG